MTGLIKFGIDYFVWHYGRGIRDVLSAWKNILWFVQNYFSIPLLVRSLFAPWKALSDSRGNSFNAAIFLQTLVVNTIMRAVGFCVRILIILCGGAIFLSVLLLIPIILLFWVLVPALTLGLFIIGWTLLFV